MRPVEMMGSPAVAMTSKQLSVVQMKDANLDP